MVKLAAKCILAEPVTVPPHTQEDTDIESPKGRNLRFVDSYISSILNSIWNPRGDPAVGKTALAQIFRSDGAHFQKNYTLVRCGSRGLAQA